MTSPRHDLFLREWMRRLALFRANPSHRNPQAKDRASTCLVLCPQAAVMSFDDRACNCQSHSHAAFHGREKRLKDLLQNVWLNPWPSIRDRELRRVVLGKMCSHGNPAIVAIRRGKSIDGIGNQIENDLLQLNAVAFDN